MSRPNSFELLTFISLLSLMGTETMNADKIMRGTTREDFNDRYRLAVWKLNRDRIDYSRYICSASALTSRHSVTACHCVLSVISTPEKIHGLEPSIEGDRRVVVSGFDLDIHIPGPTEHGHTAQVKKNYQTREVFFGTPYYLCKAKSWLWDHDIGILSVSVEFLITETHTFTQMPLYSFSQDNYQVKQETWFNKNVSCVVGGWGTLRHLHSDTRGNASTHLRIVEQILVDWPTCMRFCGSGLWHNLCNDPEMAPNKQYLSRKLCAYREEGGIGGPCYGDSGASLACLEEEIAGREYVVAVLATSLHCGQFYGGPFFYYKLASYWNLLSAFDKTLTMIDPYVAETDPKPSTTDPSMLPCIATIAPGSVDVKCDDTGGEDRKKRDTKNTKSMAAKTRLILRDVALVAVIVKLAH